MPAPRPVPPGILLAAAAVCGAAVMIVETTAVRALQPFFGSTTFVWTNVIAVALAALAAGCALGGRLADRRPSSGLLFGLMAAGGILVVLGAALAPALARLFLAEGLDLQGAGSVLARGSLAASLVLFAPPLLLLGALGPLCVRLLSAAGAGRAMGRVLSVSTAGSIAGTYLPGLVLVPALGSRGALAAAAALLVLPAAAGLAREGRRRSAGGVVLAAALLCLAAGGPIRPAPPLPGGGSSILLAERESPYQYLSVRDDRLPGEEPWRVLTINEGVYTFHALRVEGRVLTGSRYYDVYTILPFLLDPAPGAEPAPELRLGIVGFACGVNAAQWRHFWEGPYRLRITGAEIDPEVLALGREFFALPAGDGGVAAADGRPWLEHLPAGERFHALVVDAFAHELYIPFHLGTREFFELCRRRLEPGGVLAMNVYAVGDDAPNLLALENTLATAFGSCLRLSLYQGRNYVLLARNGDGPPDLGRLSAPSTAIRFGRRPGVAEWRNLRDLAAAAAAEAVPSRPRADLPVLTDDHAPLEWLTDRFLSGLEARTPAPAAVEALRRRQDRALLGIAAGWALALAGAFALSGRRPPHPSAAEDRPAPS